MLSYSLRQFGKPLAQVLRETPSPQGTEVLLKVGHCGVCHSDLHLSDGYFDLGGDARIDLTRSLNLPRTLGHEIGGTVAALGPEVGAADGVQPGDRRVVYPWIGCGLCSLCRAGGEHLCGSARALGVNRDGGFADHVLVPHPRYLLDFGSLPEAQACTLGCAGVTAYSALKKAAAGRPFTAGDALLVVGAGGVGLSGIRLARQVLGVAPIVAEIDRAKWDLARAAGAAEVIDPRADGAGKALVKATGGGVAAAVDYVGSAASFDFALGALRKGGRLVCVGLIGGRTAIMPAMVAMKAVSVIGSYVGTLAEMRELLALAEAAARAGGAALAELPLELRPMVQASETLDDLRAGRIRGRAVLQAGAA
jgi:alcohol dehydrogenase/propanol-preferring alcohol dehydrogenase